MLMVEIEKENRYKKILKENNDGNPG